MDRKEVICECMGTKAGDIIDAIKAGATTVEAVKDATRAGTSCGLCIKRIEKLIEKYA